MESTLTTSEWQAVADYHQNRKLEALMDRLTGGNGAVEATLADAEERLSQIESLIGAEALHEAVKHVNDHVRQIVGDELWANLTGDQSELAGQSSGKPQQDQAGIAASDCSPAAAGSGIQIHHVTSGDETKGWVHTHGLEQLGFPEIEIRHCPTFLAESAAKLLKEICRYMHETGKIIKDGETMGTSPRTRFRFVRDEPIPGSECHYEHERLRVVELDTPPPCCECGA